MISVSPARLSAAEILRKIETERSYSSILLPEYEEELTSRDRALCHELTLGVLRKQILLDRLIEVLTKKCVRKFDIEVVIALRLGLYQMLFLDKIPAYSAINESVNLIYRARKRSAVGLVNAVLRRASREAMPALDFASETERISVETSHPEWLIDRWGKRFGLHAATEIARANNEAPGIAFRLTARFYRRGAAMRQKILDDIAGLEPKSSDLVRGCFVIQRSDDRITELAETGDIYFQDEGSQLVSSAVRVEAGESFLDVCSAPGSKVTFVAAAVEQRKREDDERSGPADICGQAPEPESIVEQEPGNLIAAGDLHTHRLRNLRENCAKQGFGEIKIVQYDAEGPLPFAPESFDAVLVDAPCSGTGTIRHNPEIRYFLRESDFGELASKQLKILGNASNIVKRGGRLIYSTCSLEKEENEEVVDKFLNENPRFGAVASGLPMKLSTSDGFVRTFPQRDGMDGFFLAVFE